MPGFDPLIGQEPKILILGSMPGQKSLVESQYYAHPQNAFWWIMGCLIGFDSGISYEQRCRYLLTSKFAVWDVLNDCVRKGSLDRNIQKTSEKSNDFSEFLMKVPTIQMSAFNGQAAHKIFMRHWSELFERFDRLQWCQLPSTSPAHASLTKEEKLNAWRVALT